jgi:hypothetical protein
MDLLVARDTVDEICDHIERANRAAAADSLEVL